MNPEALRRDNGILLTNRTLSNYQEISKYSRQKPGTSGLQLLKLMVP